MKLLAQSTLIICITCQLVTLSIFGQNGSENSEDFPINTLKTEANVDINYVDLIDRISNSESSVTQFILIRHAEKSEGEPDPELSDVGIERARRLAVILSELEIDRVYSTQFNRTVQTATPIANDQGIEISYYSGFDQVEVVKDILDHVCGGTVVIVGHSNTIPQFINVLTGTTDYEHIESDDYDNLFVVSTRSLGESEVIHLKY